MFPMRMHHSHTDFPCRVVSYGCMKLPTVYDMGDINNHHTVYRFCLNCRLIRCAYVQRRIKVRTCIHRMTHHDDSLVKYHLSIYSNYIEIFEIHLVNTFIYLRFWNVLIHYLNCQGVVEFMNEDGNAAGLPIKKASNKIISVIAQKRSYCTRTQPKKY